MNSGFDSNKKNASLCIEKVFCKISLSFIFGDSHGSYKPWESPNKYIILGPFCKTTTLIGYSINIYLNIFFKINDTSV
jgi:hypothetical protein